AHTILVEHDTRSAVRHQAFSTVSDARQPQLGSGMSHRLNLQPNHDAGFRHERLGAFQARFGEMKNVRGTHRRRSTKPDTLHKMFPAPGAPGDQHWHVNAPGDPLAQFNVVAIERAIAIDRSQQYLAGAERNTALRPGLGTEVS